MTCEFVHKETVRGNSVTRVPVNLQTVEENFVYDTSHAENVSVVASYKF